MLARFGYQVTVQHGVQQLGQLAAVRLVQGHRIGEAHCAPSPHGDVITMSAPVMHQHAQAAAESLGPHYDTHQTAFGTTNVAVHRVAALVRLHEPGQALEYARNIDQRAISVLPPERRVNYMLDLSRSYTETGNYVEAGPQFD